MTTYRVNLLIDRLQKHRQLLATGFRQRSRGSALQDARHLREVVARPLAHLRVSRHNRRLRHCDRRADVAAEEHVGEKRRSLIGVGRDAQLEDVSAQSCCQPTKTDWKAGDVRRKRLQHQHSIRGHLWKMR